MRDTNDAGCVGCGMCCKIMTIAEINKGRNIWCQHFCQGKCSIYDSRPNDCVAYSCLWLDLVKVGSRPELKFKPSNCGVVIHGGTDGSHNVAEVNIGVDWRKGVAAEWIALCSRGSNLIVRQGTKVYLVRDGRQVAHGDDPLSGVGAMTHEASVHRHGTQLVVVPKERKDERAETEG